MKKILTLLFLTIIVSNCFSQILTFDFAGLTGNEASAPSNFNSADLTSSVISRGAGLTASANGDRFNAISWALTSIDNAISGNNYMEFTITPVAASGYSFSVSSIVFRIQRSGTGLTAIALRNSLDSYAANLDSEKAVSDITTTQTFTFTFVQPHSTSAVTYRLYGYAEAVGGSAGPGDFTGNDIVVNGATLPITLTSFDVKQNINFANISWQTATELNNSFFAIERSSDGRTFEQIGEVKGAGTSYIQQDYTYTDEKPLRGINYYRLKQVDFDGQFTYSSVVSVQFGKAGNVVIYPTPATETVNVRLEESLATDAQWQIVDMTGRVLSEGIFAAEQVQYSLPVANLTQGAYVLRVTADQVVLTQQFRKM